MFAGAGGSRDGSGAEPGTITATRQKAVQETAAAAASGPGAKTSAEVGGSANEATDRESGSANGAGHDHAGNEAATKGAEE